MSYDVWTQLCSLDLISKEKKENIQWFHDSDLLLPMASINQAVVLTADLPNQLPDDLKEYTLSDAPPELKEILLFRRQNSSKALTEICAAIE